MTTHGKAILGLTTVLLCVSLHAGEGEPDYLRVRDLTPVKVHPTPQHPPVVMVQDGAPQAKVYVAEEKPSKNLTLLLKELVEVVKLSTGAELEVVKELPADNVPAIVIGDCPASRAAGIDAATIPIEGYVVKTAANRVYLVGSTAPLPTVTVLQGPYANDGTAWAVADFLERFVGVRWYWPTEVNGRSVVQARTLAIRPAHYSDEPVFRKRECYPWGGYVKKNGEWRALWFDAKSPVPGERAIPPGVDFISVTSVLAGLRMGNSWPYMVRCHNPQQLWRDAKLVEEHKGIFAKKKNGEPNLSMLCYSSQETLDFLLAGCERFWDKGQKDASWLTDTAVTVSPGDQPVDCACEGCQKVIREPGSASKLVALFVKRLAEEVKRRWPGKMVAFLPYWNYAKCPEDVEFPDNVQIQVCTSTSGLPRDLAEQKAIDRNHAAWRRKSPDRIQTWEYSNGATNKSLAPTQFPHIIKDYYTRNREMIVGSFINGEFLNEWSRFSISLHCWMKVLWNPEVDVDAIMDVFCERMFGKAAGASRELLKMMCDRWENTPIPAFLNTGRPNADAFRKSFPPEVVERMAQLWEQARGELKDDPLALQRFEYFTWTFEHFLKEAQELPDAKKR